MSLDQSGFSEVVTPRLVEVRIKDNHPLIQLANVLPWDKLIEIILPDIKSTTKQGKWWLGRPLRLRIHLGAYLIQQLFNLTDRQTEYGIQDNAAYQLFCGKYLVKKWHYPDHTKIEEFRSRLSADTQKQLANAITSNATSLGFADASHIDIDSTVQEANMRYPTDGQLLCKLGEMGSRIANYLNDKISVFKFKPMEVDLKGIKSRARRYFFTKNDKSGEVKTKNLTELLDYVSKEVDLVISNGRCMGQHIIDDMPWNIKNIFFNLINKGKKYLSDVRSFLDTGNMVKDKLLSFHLSEVCCINKNKPGKKYQFGRVFQLARTKGNFLFTAKCDTPNQSDKQSLELILNTHSVTFDNQKILSIATDKGYYSKANEKIANQFGIEDIGIQRPSSVKQKKIKNLPIYRENELINRRAGIEPLIGHAKNRSQLARSRMKSDTTIEASGFAAVLGFNMRQMIRYQTGKIRMDAT